MTVQNRYNLRHLLIGIPLSTLFIYIVCFIFCDSLMTYDWDPSVQTFVHSPGTQYIFRSEGWGVSQVGKHGIYGIHDIAASKSKKIFIWGDSYIAATQVDDDEKMAQVLTRLFHSVGLKDYMGVGIGHPGNHSADYYYKIPRYEKIVTSVVAHFIFLGEMVDILPDQNTKRCKFHSKPDFHFIDYKEGYPRYQNIKKLLGSFNLGFLWDLTNSLMEQKLRFMPGPLRCSVKNPGTERTQDIDPQAWEFLLHKFQEQTEAPICFIYAPSVPRIRNGRINFYDKNSEAMKKFAGLCLEHNIGFINMASMFTNNYYSTGNFPRGFSNSKPGEGHLNAEGHRLVASAIFRRITDKNIKRNAIFTN